MPTFDPLLAGGLLVAGAVCILGPLALAVAWQRKSGAPFSAFAYGALIFIVFQLILRLPWQIPLGRMLIQSYPAWHIAIIAFSALTAGLFEEGGRWVGYRYLLQRDRSLRVGVMYGLGHGGAESALLVGLSLLGLVAAWMLAARGLISDPHAIEAIRRSVSSLTLGSPLLAVVERASAIGIQVALSLIVLQVFRRAQWRWLALAVVIHSVVDFVGVVMQHELNFPAALSELVIAAMAIALLWFALRLSRSQPDSSIAAGPGGDPATADWPAGGDR